MSWQATAYVCELTRCVDGAPLSRGQKLVLLVLANHHNPSLRIAFPSLPRLATAALTSLATIKRDLLYLEQHGVILRRQPRKGAHGTNVYSFPELDAQETAQNEPFSSRRKSGSQSGHNQLTTGSLVTSNKEEPEPKPKRVPPAHGRTRLSQAERDSWDLRRWQEEMKATQPQAGMYIADPNTHWCARARDAAFVAGLSPERLIQLLRQSLGDDSIIDRVYPRTEEAADAAEPPKQI